VRLERVTLVNATLGPPSDPRGALSPRWLDTSRAASLWLVDTLVFTSAKVLGQYTAFLLSQRAAAGGRTQTRFYTVSGGGAGRAASAESGRGRGCAAARSGRSPCGPARFWATIPSYAAAGAPLHPRPFPTCSRRKRPAAQSPNR
jgi:hypothetical protein